MDQKSKDKDQIGVVGLGLMGSSITTALVVSGYKVIALAPIAGDLKKAPEYFHKQLNHARSLDLLDHPVEYYEGRIILTEDYRDLKDCSLVLECVIEDREIKAEVFRRIEDEVDATTIIGTNTSAMPISSLQEFLEIPGRFMGIHWAEPAYATRFLEITCGTQTDFDLAKGVAEWALDWNKEPTLLRKDIRGFITNRLMYAVYREALSLENKNIASLEDLDKAVRYDMGAWISVMGIFQRMDYTGLEEMKEELKALFPQLNNTPEVPAVMKEIVRQQSRGIHNQKGLFSYSEVEAQKWAKAFSRFNRDIYLLSEKYAGENH